MRRFWNIVTCALALGAAPAAAQNAETVNKSLVRVFAFKDGKPVMIATGFAIGNRGFVVTADHVVSAGEPRVQREGEPADPAKARPGKVVFTSKPMNLAIVEVSNLGAPGLALAPGAAKQGIQVYLFGYPDGDARSSTLTAGLVSRIVTQDAGGKPAQFVQHGAKGGPGTGGGPIVNACGAVVAVNGFVLQSGEGLGIAAAEVANAARANKITWTTAPPCNR